jgi:predicted extracellular nuclease
VFLLSYELTALATTDGFLPEVGSEISVTGKISEYYTATQMVDVLTSSVIQAAGSPTMPTPTALTTGVFASSTDCNPNNEPYEVGRSRLTL